MKKIMILAFAMLMLVGCSNGSGGSTDGENKTPSNKTLSNTEAMEFLEKASKAFDESMIMYQEEFDAHLEFPYIENGEIKIDENQRSEVYQVNRVNKKDALLYEIKLSDGVEVEHISVEKYTDEKKKIGTVESFFNSSSPDGYSISKGESIDSNFVAVNPIKLLMEDFDVYYDKYYTTKLEETDEFYILRINLSDVNDYNAAIIKKNGHKPYWSNEDGDKIEFDKIKEKNEYIFDKDYNLIETHYVSAEDCGNNVIVNTKSNWKYKKIDKMKYSYEEVMELLSQAKQAE